MSKQRGPANKKPASKPQSTARGTARGSKPVEYRRTRFGMVITWIGRVVFMLFLVSLVFVIVGLNRVYEVYQDVRDDVEQVVAAELPDSSTPTIIYARDFDSETSHGTRLGKLFAENRQVVGFDDLPPILIACFLSTEDKRFFEHQGVDFVGTIRAIIRGRGKLSDIRGASTISQQLARNVYLREIRSVKTIDRKIQEYIIAMALEKRFTKEQILEAYLNHIFLGANAHGVKIAAEKYFNKDLSELTLAECALLAGLPQSPTKYNPYIYPDEALVRRNVVLNLLDTRIGTSFFDSLGTHAPGMFASLTLTHQDIQAALETPIKLIPPEHERSAYEEAEYFTSYVANHILYDRYQEDYVKRQGMDVVTTLNPTYQKWAEEIVKERIDKARTAYNVSQGAVILMEAATGEVLVCVGGYEWHSETGKGPDETNRALIEDRPVGSTFKAFTYATAYEQGFSPYTTVWDGPNEYYTDKTGLNWPTNSDGTYLGWMSICYGLQKSRNAASVDLIVNNTGIEPVIQTARKMGLTADLPAVAALTLGVADVKLIEMVEAFNTFPNGGKHVDSILIKRIYKNGILVDEYDNPGAVLDRTNRALSSNTAWMMVQNMRRVVNAGTGERAILKNIDLNETGRVDMQVGGKTGTHDKFADAWFIGYTPELVCGVWVGNDNFSNQMNSVYGGHLPADIWKDIMLKIYSRQVHTEGEGEEAIEVVDYISPYQQYQFERPAGASFNGFDGNAIVCGTKMIKDEETGEWVPENPVEDEEAPFDQETQGESTDEDDFYHEWNPPADMVFFMLGL